MSGPDERALLELNLRRETWCQVELNPRQFWLRAERRHYRSHLRTSPVLLTALTAAPQRRAARPERPPPAKLPERRHFEDSCKTSACYCHRDSFSGFYNRVILIQDYNLIRYRDIKKNVSTIISYPMRIIYIITTPLY